MLYCCHNWTVAAKPSLSTRERLNVSPSPCGEQIIFHPPTKISQTGCGKAVTLLSLLPWKEMHSTSFNLHGSDTPCYSHCSRLTIFPSCSIGRSTLHLNKFFSRTAALWNQLPRGFPPIATILTCSALGLTFILLSSSHEFPLSLTLYLVWHCTRWTLRITSGSPAIYALP